MLEIKKKLLEDLISKLSEVDDPLMELLSGDKKPDAKVSVMALKAKPEIDDEGSGDDEKSESPEDVAKEKELGDDSFFDGMIEDDKKKKKLGA